VTMHQLRIVLSIAKHSSITRASEEHHVSQPSVSQQIRLLEQEYGIKLYVKNGNGIEFTPAGQKFIASAKQILSQVDKLEKECKGILSHPNGNSITVGAAYHTSVAVISLVLNAFKKLHPDAQFSLRTEATPPIEEMVLKSEVDVAVTIKPSYHPDLVYEPHGQARQMAIVSADHPLARGSKLTPKELSEVPIVIKRSITHPSLVDQICNAMAKQGYSMNIALQCETPEDVRAAVKSGIGLGFIFEDYVIRDIKRGKLKVLEISGLKMKWNHKSYIIYHKERILSPYAKEFLAFLRNWPPKIARRKPPLVATAAPASYSLASPIIKVRAKP